MRDYTTITLCAEELLLIRAALNRYAIHLLDEVSAHEAQGYDDVAAMLVRQRNVADSLRDRLERAAR